MGGKKDNESVRLDKFLADAGAGTRGEVKKLIRQGRVSVNGICAGKPEEKIDPQADTVGLDGKILRRAPEFVYYLLNKPAGCVSATEDSRDRTVLDLVPKDRRRKLFPVGRLDKDTEGLLLITDDGELAHRLLAPGKHVDKTYYAKVDGEMTKEDVAAFAEGLDIGDEKRTLSARLEILRVEGGKSEIRLTIQEGRFHQVKRMVEAVGKKVTYLKRLSMGSLTLPNDLREGDWRPLTREELKELRGQKEGCV